MSAATAPVCGCIGCDVRHGTSPDPTCACCETITVIPQETTATVGAGTYLVGLPVVVTVDEDGRVTLALCVEDAASAVLEVDDDVSADHEAHVDLIQAALTARTFTVTSA